MGQLKFAHHDFPSQDILFLITNRTLSDATEPEAEVSQDETEAPKDEPKRPPNNLPIKKILTIYTGIDNAMKKLKRSIDVWGFSSNESC